ncbi:MAG: ATP-dependent DNA helicase [Oligoflexia bacterium]|nr:ATP-dependent DNA helicase [Oligoflexia bacterium]
MTALRELLKSRFGFTDFRPSQEQVCEAVASGRDALLVMPTGAGKSLCYQLPGLARGGTTLVISPLLALIDDQVAKLKALGFRAEQIHSGRTREDSRKACVLYLQGELDFLFIAPERLGVRGFPEMLERRRPGLIAIDEAHCISEWGHDFRPDYRRLGERLRGLRPTPVIAMTATATPVVQEDIVQQLGMAGAERFIQGFRRTNIAIRVHEVPPSGRAHACRTVLKDTGRCPAIVYAPTRKAAEEVAAELKSVFRAEAYHAGMTPAAREDVQTRFLSGKLDVIVATVAFGMGIDKADVRTVVHAGLSGSVEGYYQEIGRAGRDGKPSVAILLYSYADQRTHDFFFNRDYPEVETLQKIYKSAGEAPLPPLPKEALREKAGKLDPETFEKALEKLWIHGGVRVDPEENVARGDPSWRRAYERQRKHRERSLQDMMGFARATDCRMLLFLRHFGDHGDKQGPCGSCDACGGTADQTRTLNEKERGIASLLLAACDDDGLSAGRLFERIVADEKGTSRREFEAVLEVLTRAKLLSVRTESFEKGSETISYRKVALTSQGARAKGSDLEALRVSASPWAEGEGEGRSSRKRKNRQASKKRASAAPDIAESLPPVSAGRLERLRSWRLQKARSQGVPAFRIFGDRVLFALIEHRPASLEELLEIHGLGPKLREKYGPEILEILR